jgi:hypothetical protein
VEENRQKFSTRKPGKREREKVCWKVTFSRENFSPEKTLKYIFSGENINFTPDEHDSYGAQARRQA